MANKLRNDKEIHGIQVQEVEYLISQFADDTDLYLLGEQRTVTKVFSILSYIEANTGLCISYEKTNMYRIGSLANTNAKMVTPRKVNWSNDYINTLDIDMCNNDSQWDKNFDIVITKMKTVMNMWYY